MNNFIWITISYLGWYYWAPCVILACVNVLLLAALHPPVTHLGRLARVLAWLAHIPMLFSIEMNSLGMIALPLMVLANNVLYLQFYLACRKQPQSPNKAYGVRRLLNTMVAKA